MNNAKKRLLYLCYHKLVLSLPMNNINLSVIEYGKQRVSFYWDYT